jgi:hypothetical protein
LNQELSLDVIVNKEDGSMLELTMDKDLIFYYDINEQRKHKFNNKLSIPHFRCSFDNIGNNININTIKGYYTKIKRMSYLPRYFYNNNVNLMYRCFNSGHILNYVLSRNNRLINNKQHRFQMISKDITQRLKEINKDIIPKVHVEEKKSSTDKEKI